ncbi:hypothetical protein LSUB1_G005023 [Lachnellula subtilissima]|uniref:Uncharacterized protein n=1 Tax=Lachnellula subtilissima TaxID=602034 RepID=A0A8H8RJY4_9HELO|nr:hypothetical protein LSUB1_G005023 [Lachnellula subtilissima]
MNPPYSEKAGFPQQPRMSDSDAPSYTPFRTTFACLSLHQSDRIRMMQFRPEDVSAIRSVIQRHWTKGLQSERVYSASYEFKLSGYPWYGQGSDAITSRVVVREIFAYLFSQGWILHLSTDVSRSKYDKDSLIFRKQQTPPPPSEFIAITFNQGDRMRLIGAPNALLADVRMLLKEMNLLQAEDWKDGKLQAWEYKMYGWPWHATGEETMTTRLLLLKLLETLESRGWSVYASIDQSTGTEDRSETDSWYVVKERGWVEGSAVFHR